ncbi:MAG: UDP-glucose 4-epimerase GalE [Acidobacteriia bacterium]|nr:UDP-glucose 4-epimerase GalE [Terriglobia bacterium]
MRVLVTGGAGYIGSQTAKALAQAGHEPIVYDDLSSGHRWAVKWGASVEGDLADTRLLATTLNAHRIEAILHFAASIQVSESVENPRKYFWNNVVNTLRLLDTALDEGVQAIVFSSSAAVYGIPQKVPIPEDHPTRPASPYGETKLMMERALGAYGAAYRLRWVALRYFNAAGADPDGELGEEHHPESHLIPLVIQAALGRRPHVEVFGADYPTPDGTAIRDYIHIADLADAHVRALEYLARGGESVALNLGTGTGHSVREVIAAVGRFCDGKVPFRDAPRRAGDPPILVADPARAMEVLNWKPKHTGLDSIVASAWKWHEKNSEL